MQFDINTYYFFDHQHNRRFKPVNMPKELTVIVDSNEQLALINKTCTDFIPHIKMPLENGDYSLLGYEDKIVCERKMQSDWLHYIGKDRKNTELKLDRMQNYPYKAFIIETPDVYDVSRAYKLTKESVRGFLKSLRFRRGFHVFIHHNRDLCQMFLLDFLTYSFKLIKENEKC